MHMFVLFGFWRWWMWTAAAASKTSADSCLLKLNEDLKYINNCNSTAEAHQLDCFGRRVRGSMIEYKCVWNLAQYKSFSFYDLCISQRKTSCKRMTLESTTLVSTFALLDNFNMTAYAIAKSADLKDCIFERFSDHPLLMSMCYVRCGPPNVDFTRGSGDLRVKAQWQKSKVNKYSVKFREQNTTMWKEVESQDQTDCIVGNLTSSLSYEIRVQCVVSELCAQCPSGDIIRVPQELVDAPVVKKTYRRYHNGRRTIIMEWEHVHAEAVDHYNVSVQKVSERQAESIYSVSSPAATLILSYSAYTVSINAINAAGKSPAAKIDLEAAVPPAGWGGGFNVSVTSNSSLRLWWNKTLSQQYRCFSIDCWDSGRKPTSFSFYSLKNNYKIKTHVAFEPYKRYSFFLHLRPYKDVCKLKEVNSSERTYGRAQAYFAEGTPLMAPGNISISNVTEGSFVISWIPVAVDDLRGFLQGYVIHYLDTLDSIEKNITVNAEVNSYELQNLQSRSVYRIGVSAYTAAGEGKLNIMNVKTKARNSVSVGGMLAGVIVGVTFLLLALHLLCQLLQRSKNLLWPNIPNPCNSNAVQKIEKVQEGLDILEPLFRQNIEETEDHVSVVEVKKESQFAGYTSECIQTCTGAGLNESVALESAGSLTENQPPQKTQSPTLPAVTDTTCRETCPLVSNKNGSLTVLPDNVNTIDTAGNNMVDNSNIGATDQVGIDVARSVAPFVTDYTTMELFQQFTKVEIQCPSIQTGESRMELSTLGQDYIRQTLSCSEDLPIERSVR